jgi:hypothetical protein
MNEREVEIRRLKTLLIPSARSAVVHARDEESKLEYQKTLIKRLDKLAELENQEIRKLETKLEKM